MWLSHPRDPWRQRDASSPLKRKDCSSSHQMYDCLVAGELPEPPSAMLDVQLSRQNGQNATSKSPYRTQFCSSRAMIDHVSLHPVP